MQWIITATEQPPEWFIQAVQKYAATSKGIYAAQLLWQRGIKQESQLAAFINFKTYQPASAFEFGQEIQLAVARLQQARNKGEKIAIWGDFDADGITATAVLWDGLGQFFQQHQQLDYYIPNRLKESHGLNEAGIANLAKQGCTLIVTCDTGSTNIDEIIYAQKLGIDIIVTDHHTLPPERPPVTAIINPRYLPNEHQLFHLSGVGVAYKLIEALYKSLPDVPQNPLEDLLDLVAVGLIADLVQLSGDCRYLAQLGIQRLQADFQQPPAARRRPGVGRLLELCQRSGDRPTDISFGLGPRINAVSRIQGDASFCVELLTSRDINRCHQLAEVTELANTRRKSLQKDVQAQVTQKLTQLDLSTTSVIVLEDPQWPAGVLGLVAGQVAQETGRPTILLSTEGLENEQDSSPSLARGSARSVNSVDLYQLVKHQAHLLHRFGGHPFAAGLSLLAQNIPLFTQAINQQLRQTLGSVNLTPTVQADIAVTVADLGKELFLELKLLEPCGMGNPVPKLLIQNCWFENAWHRNQQDSQGKKVQYIKAEFDIRDDSSKNPFPGIWWGHYKDELPIGRCDCIAELDYNTFKKRYEIRLIAVRPNPNSELKTQHSTQILDWRNLPSPQSPAPNTQSLILEECPMNWDDLRAWWRRSLYNNQQLVLAWSKPSLQPPQEIWLTLVGIAKYLSRTNQLATRIQILEKLKISDRSLLLGIKALKYWGFTVTRQDRSLQFIWSPNTIIDSSADTAIAEFLATVSEEQFQQKYFAEVPLSTVMAMVNRV
ncbi:putative exonuclease, RecJ-like protein [Trichormus variabilis ATCC 29413]|uniref:Single-stranded-DNA-specific exonuclease RecJ n=2 Tax=Anabaena variabilis TaxID=264691 RepID=Q3MEY7_TRIV2|nr:MULTISPECIES: single-stranded-DNA-specific exonuclease RecJ [Nostocaceae]ABA20449.1 putative exonuclease, RecJ-like protein [Trichormus variabilis ATCC 29413]MBC1216634.1 single-stranded-DNA-specific exonuclease RecJ [Trichormus variabilis ARAD]MBC1258170.1 single-stranded-DNA-specific exonuclease RecJ [Trichormus variabilis V5]MBC1269318.1 single-stranded-DNA-specific exonuclease RecJ [Trichormus variabilis FSR]MBC1304909.1 single-stranded-DNA-specific exonuclease RecJ [Trichormus variabil